MNGSVQILNAIEWPNEQLNLIKNDFKYIMNIWNIAKPYTAVFASIVLHFTKGHNRPALRKLPNGGKQLVPFKGRFVWKNPFPSWILAKLMLSKDITGLEQIRRDIGGSAMEITALQKTRPIPGYNWEGIILDYLNAICAPPQQTAKVCDEDGDSDNNERW